MYYLKYKDIHIDDKGYNSYGVPKLFPCLKKLKVSVDLCMKTILIDVYEDNERTASKRIGSFYNGKFSKCTT